MSEAISGVISSHIRPDLKIREFEGPLDLLFHLIEKNDIDIYDIPISEITEQYMAFLDNMQKLDMEVASEFLVMAATLVHIKSRMMLPGRKADDQDEGEDPREELVISLLRYKRCKMLAGELKTRHATYSDCMYRLPSTAKDLGIEIVYPPQEFEAEEFDKAVADVTRRNEIRFADISSKITHILKKDKLSVKERMKSVFLTITKRGRVFFHELFNKDKTEKIDRIVGFLAILELLRSNKIKAEQKKPFDSILLEEKGMGDK
ncbi:MAG: segregation/condensation protein A [Clostridiales bacterium]|nr:segregation/condensation protein A [Clostridiales bacterium]